VNVYDKALAARCGLCWASPGTVCQRYPAGVHVGRFPDTTVTGLAAYRIVTEAG
jgi:hypothetical protein